jgi:imidazoleglycerol phosphate dehydratase HisB
MAARIALSGLLFSGKDYVAEAAGLVPISFAEPMYKICEYLFGFCDKTLPDHRAFLQTIGQWGWGCHDSEKAPHNVVRGAFILLMRRFGSAITSMSEIKWDRFGKDKTFWVDALLSRVRNSYSDTDLAVTNCRFPHELGPLKEAGFKHFLVRCSEKTRIARHGGPIPDKNNFDISEQMARDLASTMRDDHIIWNDDNPIPAVYSYLTVEEFVKWVKNCDFS